MADLNEVFVFIQVVRSGSFTKAALELGMPKSTVSAKVSDLERRLGLTLIQRTTRSLHVTPAGEAYFQRCVRGYEEIRDAEQEIFAAQAEPSGLLRLTAPVELGSSILPDVLADFGARYPKVSVEALLTDRRVDLLGEGVDLAIRAGQLADSSMIARKLGSTFFGAFANPSYLKRSPTLEHPRDLKDHECLQFTSLSTDVWKLTGPKSNVDVKIKSRFLGNDLALIKKLAINGRGIALLPAFYCGEELASAELVRVLPDWRTSRSPVHFVYPAQKFVLPKLSAFIAEAAPKIQTWLQTPEGAD